MSSCTSTPGTGRATSTLMTSSSRGGGTVSGGVRSHSASSRPPAGVIRKPFCGPSPSGSSDSTRPSRSRRCRVVYTCPTLSGQTSPVLDSNSCRSWRPYFGPSLSKASSACRTLISTSPEYTRYDTGYPEDVQGADAPAVSQGGRRARAPGREQRRKAGSGFWAREEEPAAFGPGQRAGQGRPDPVIGRAPSTASRSRRALRCAGGTAPRGGRSPGRPSPGGDQVHLFGVREGRGGV